MTIRNLALKIGVGLGKTHSYISEMSNTLARLRDMGITNEVLVVLVPQHTLADEVKDRFERVIAERGLNLKVAIWRGRQALDDDGAPMCHDYKTVREAEKVFVDIDREICGPCPHHPKNQGDCQYLLQQHLKADVWVGAHNLIFNKPPGPIKEAGVAIVVIDEEIIQAGLKGLGEDKIDIPIDSIESWPLPPGEQGETLQKIRHKLKLAVRDEPAGWLRASALGDAGLSLHEAVEAEGLEWDRKLGPKDEKDWRKRHGNASLADAIDLWNAIESALALDIDASGRIYYAIYRSGRIEITTDKNDVKILRISKKRAIHKGWMAPTLVVDATLEFDLLQNFWWNLRTSPPIEAAAPFQRVIQVVGNSFAKWKLEPPRKKDDVDEDNDGDRADDSRADNKAENNRRDALAIIMREHLRAKSRHTLVVSYKRVIEAMSSPVPGEKSFRCIAPNIDGAWFGNVTGVDRWKNADLIIVIGRPQPEPYAVERLAGALTGAAPTISGLEQYEITDGARVLKVDAETYVNARTEVQRHPDPTCEAFRRMICEGAIVQAVGRVRGVNRTAADPVRVLILNDVATQIPVDEIIDFEKFKPSPIDLQIAAGGIAFLDGTRVIEAYRELWHSVRAANQALSRHKASLAEDAWRYRPGQFLVEHPVRLSRVTFQLAGAGQRAQCAFYDPTRVLDPKAAIEELISKPIAKITFDGEVLSPDAEMLPAPLGGTQEADLRSA